MTPRILLFSLLLSACAGLPFEPAGPDAAPDPSLPGPFAVGVRTIVLEDAERLRPDGSPRRLETEVWYPATEASRGKPGTSYDVTTLLTDAQRAALGATRAPLVETSAVRDAAPEREHGPYPLVVYSHGQAESRWSAAYYTVLLASHGYVVISADHTGNGLRDVAHDAMDNQGQVHGDRPLDVIALLDHFTALAKTDPLFGLVAAESIGLTGHSFGGLTTLRVAKMDDRVKAIVPQTPPAPSLAWVGLPNENEPFEIPTLLQVAHQDRITTWEEASLPTWNALSGPRVLMDLKTAGHSTYGGLCVYAEADLPLTLDGQSVREVLSDGCSELAPPPQKAEALIGSFGVGFFNATLRRSPGSWKWLSQERAEALAPGVADVTVDR